MYYISELRFTWHLLAGRVVSRHCQAHIMSLIKAIKTKHYEPCFPEINDKIIFEAKED